METTSTLTVSDANVIPCLLFNFNSNSYVPSRNCLTTIRGDKSS